MLAFVCAVLGCGIIQKAFRRFRDSAAELVFCMALLACSILSMVSSTYSAFLYMNF